jgi:hypothetical protein
MCHSGSCNNLCCVHILEGFGIYALEHVLCDIDAAVGQVFVKEILSLGVHTTLGMVALYRCLDSSELYIRSKKLDSSMQDSLGERSLTSSNLSASSPREFGSESLRVIQAFLFLELLWRDRSVDVVLFESTWSVLL